MELSGVDVRDLSFAALRGAVGVVTQDGHLFHDTIRANLRYAAPEATDAELVDALRRARLGDLLDALPDGLDTVVGERGYRLSGGERQRLTIARLLLARPRVVILDEATAHLDSESEAAVQAALAEALEGRTAIVIAHRLSTVRAADEIAVVEGRAAWSSAARTTSCSPRAGATRRCTSGPRCGRVARGGPRGGAPRPPCGRVRGREPVGVTNSRCRTWRGSWSCGVKGSATSPSPSPHSPPCAPLTPTRRYPPRHVGRAVDLIGRLSLAGLVGVLERVDLLVGNDSGPRHLAEAVGTATVGVFTRANLVDVSPLFRARHRVLVSWASRCMVCRVDFVVAPCDHGASVLGDVLVDDVLDAALDLLGLRDREPAPQSPDVA